MAKRRVVDEEMRFNIVINGNEAQKELYDLEKRNRKLTESNKELKAARAKLFQQGKRGSEEYKRLSAEINKNSAEINQNKTRMVTLRKNIGLTSLTMAQLRKEAARLRIQLNNMTPGSAQFKKLQGELRAVQTRMAELRQGSRATQGTLSKMSSGFNKYAALGATVIATLTGMVVSIQKVIDINRKFSDAQSDVRKTTGMTQKEVDELTKSFGLLNTRTSRINLLKIAEEGGRIGIPKDEIEDFVAVMDKAVVALGDSFPGGAEETASKLGKLKLLFKETKDQKVEDAYESIGSAINELGANGVATESNIAEFATRIGALPDALKPTISEALGLGAAFEESGIKAEIASRSYGIVLKQASKETEKFANVMGISQQAVEDLINQDPLEFMIKFAEGLDGMNATETAQTLDYLGVSADGANKVLGAISNNTDRFRELLNLSNTSMEEATSLTTEFNVKNNNLASLLDKISKRIDELMSSDFVTGFLGGMLSVFGRLIGAVKSADEVMAEQVKTSYESAKANRKLAAESQALLNEYEDLYQDGVEPTKEAKEQLDLITLKLKDRLGESVMAIDKETGAYKLNTEAVREQIKLKRLAADEEAATLASRLVGAQEELKSLEDQKRDAKREFDLREKDFERANQQELADIRNSNAINASQKQQMIERLAGYKELSKARLALQQVNANILKQQENEVDLTEKLNELNFSAADAQNLINPDTGGGQGPQEGDEKVVDGVTFVFKGGQWVVKKTFTPYKPTTGAGTKQDPMIELLRKSLDLKNQLIADDFKRELAILRTNRDRKVEELEKQLVTEGRLTEKQMAMNGAIREQVRLEEEVHLLEVGKLLEESIAKDIQLQQDQYEKERQLRLTEFNEKLAQEDLTLDEIEKRRAQFDKEELQRKAAHTQALIARVKEIFEEGEFEGIKLDLMNEESQQRTLEFIEKLKAILAKIGVEIKEATQKENEAGDSDGLDEAGYLGSVDVLGTSIEEWEQAFDNIDTLAGKIQLAEYAVQGLMNAWSMYTQFASAADARRLQEFETNNAAQQEALKNRLDAGLISRRQYDQAIDGLDRELRRKQAEMEYKAAKRQKEMSIANIIMNTAIGVSKALAQGGALFGIPWSYIVGGIGAAQLALALAQPLPAKGFADGYYGTMPVRREQDGKVFDAAFGGQSRSGMVSKPTVFLAGEQGENFPELIVSGPDLKRFDPSVTASLANELRRINGTAPGFEGGYVGSSISEAGSGSSGADYGVLLLQLNSLLSELNNNGVIAYMSKDMRNIKDLRDEINRLSNYEQKAIVDGN